MVKQNKRWDGQGTDYSWGSNPHQAIVLDYETASLTRRDQTNSSIETLSKDFNLYSKRQHYLFLFIIGRRMNFLTGIIVLMFHQNIGLTNIYIYPRNSSKLVIESINQMLGLIKCISFYLSILLSFINRVAIDSPIDSKVLHLAQITPQLAVRWFTLLNGSPVESKISCHKKFTSWQGSDISYTVISSVKKLH
jgi:hypothetical protein